LPWLSLWHKLCMRTFNDYSKGKSPFQHPAHLSLILLTLSSIITLLFLSRSNGVATGIGSLALGLDGRGVRLGLGNLPNFFCRCTPIPL
jgi:hypothetical protein